MNMLQSEFEPLVLQQHVLDTLREKSIVITGATGLIGSYLIHYLMYLNNFNNLNISVIALCRSEKKARDAFDIYMKNPFFQLLISDVTEPVRLPEHTDFIIHAASPADPLSYSKTPVETMKSNLLGVMYLLEALKNIGHGRMLYISSGEVYGELDGNNEKSEHMSGYVDPMNPRSCYPSSKRAAETLCASYSSEYGVDIVSARLCHVYGPTITSTNSRADAQFLRKAAAKENIVMKSLGLQKRSYCYVGDVASALLTLLALGVSGQAYNVASPSSNITIRTYAETLAELAGVSVEFQLPDSIEEHGYSKISHAVLSADKLCSLGWESKFSLKAGLELTLSSYKERMGL